MENQNITFVNNNIKFNFRVAVLIVNNNHVLLETSGEFWNMIGGRVQFGENSLEAAKRELKEELGLSVDNLKLINVSENFFNWMGYNQQEMLFVYKAVLDDDCEILNKTEFKCLDTNQTFKWHNISDVENLVCKPNLIKKLIYQDEKITHEIERL